MLLLYDAECGFCSRAAAWLVRRGVREVRPLQLVDLAALGVDAERATREIPAVLDDGRVAYGARAIGFALATGPAWLRAAGWLVRRPLARPAASVYALVARNRYRLPGGCVACRRGG